MSTDISILDLHTFTENDFDNINDYNSYLDAINTKQDIQIVKNKIDANTNIKNEITNIKNAVENNQTYDAAQIIKKIDDELIPQVDLDANKIDANKMQEFKKNIENIKETNSKKIEIEILGDNKNEINLTIDEIDKTLNIIGEDISQLITDSGTNKPLIKKDIEQFIAELQKGLEYLKMIDKIYTKHKDIDAIEKYYQTKLEITDFTAADAGHLTNPIKYIADKTKSLKYQDIAIYISNANSLIKMYNLMLSNSNTLSDVKEIPKMQQITNLDLVWMTSHPTVTPAITKILNDSSDLLKEEIKELDKKMQQKGGDPTAIKKRLILAKINGALDFINNINNIYGSLIDSYTMKIFNIIQKINLNDILQNRSSTTTMSSDTDYILPLVKMISYKIGKLNNFDEQIIKICDANNIDEFTTIALIVAQKKLDIERCLNHVRFTIPGLFQSILRLKKLSAEYNFRINYNIDNIQINILLQNQRIW